VGTPALIFAVMLKRRRYLTNFDNKTRFGFVFNGYKLSEFYWEFVVMARKVVVISLTVFFSEISVEIQAIVCLGVLAVFLVIQSKNEPFTSSHMNTLELFSIATATITIYCGMYYLTKELEKVSELVFFLLMVASNACFIIYWSYYVLKVGFELLINSSSRLKAFFYREDGFDKDMYNEDRILKGSYMHEGVRLCTLLPERKEPEEPLEEINSMLDLYRQAFKYIDDVESEEGFISEIRTSS